VPAVTLADLRTSAYTSVEGNTELYKQPEVDYTINEALGSLNLLAGFYQITVDLPDASVVNRHVYDIPKSILIPLSVAIDNVPLHPIGFSTLSRTDPDWMNRLASPGNEPVYWMPIGITKFALAPADYLGGRILSVTGIGEVPDLVNATDKIVLNDEHSDAIKNLVGHRLPLKMPGAEFQQAASLYREYLHDAKALARWTGFKAPRFFIEAKQER